jgi:uncharacterized protein (DUF488 family)
MSANTLMALEQGRTRDPGFLKVAALCRALNLRMDELQASVAPSRTDAEAAMRHGIVSVGYEGWIIEEFVQELANAGVTTVVDVRLNAISRKPGFSKSRLSAALGEAGIDYRHLKNLGNPKTNREPFWTGRVAEGQAVFRDLLAGETAAEELGMLTRLAREQVVAVLCFEHDQGHCHREVVIDEVTKRQPLPVLALR